MESAARNHNPSNVASSMREALELVENLPGVVTTMDAAAAIWPRLGDYRPAQVLFATKYMDPKFLSFEEQVLSETEMEAMDAMLKDHLPMYREISECREFKCCRGLALGKHMESSKIVRALQPLMHQQTTARTHTTSEQKLSHYSDLLDVVLQFTHVHVDDGKLEEWEPVEDWMSATISKCPLLTEILDPAFFYIQGPGGSPAPDWTDSVLDHIPVGERDAGSLEVRPQPVRRAPDQPIIPNLHQFFDSANARMALFVLQMHANMLATDSGTPRSDAQLDILRHNVTSGGMVWM